MSTPCTSTKGLDTSETRSAGSGTIVSLSQDEQSLIRLTRAQGFRRKDVARSIDQVARLESDHDILAAIHKDLENQLVTLQEKVKGSSQGLEASAMAISDLKTVIVAKQGENRLHQEEVNRLMDSMTQ